MKGALVHNSTFGVGRILDQDGSRVMVLFFRDRNRMTLASSATLKRWLIPINGAAATKDAGCRVIARTAASGWNGLSEYEVEFVGGRLGKVTEDQIQPTESALVAKDPVTALQWLQHGSLGAFRCRETFADAHALTLRAALGTRSLVGSRIDLRPHQAYVAGVVILDWKRRYILADEVGLGKTIEAGIVAHQILAEKPEARILIIAPGSLIQQWLCELYAKFVGHVFALPELHGKSGSGALRQILSYSAFVENCAALTREQWDLVIVDEVHNALDAHALFEAVHALSKKAGALLLLSALPAQHREEEFLRLLSLLSPTEYGRPDADAIGRFQELYARQRKIGVVLGWAARKLPEVISGERSRDSLTEKIAEMAAWPMFANDETLPELLKKVRVATHDYESTMRSLLHYLAENYRVNRRILRNRRTRLIQAGEMSPTERCLVPITYQPEELEAEARSAAKRLLQVPEPVDPAVVRTVGADLLQAMADPDALVAALELAQEAAKKPEGEGTDVGTQSSYQRWQPELIGAWRGLGRLDSVRLQGALEHAQRWQRSKEQPRRLAALIAYLRRIRRTQPAAKVIVFAGYPGLAEKIAQHLSAAFGLSSVAQFVWSMRDVEKDEQVRRIVRDPAMWVLVSDESGGEGRNFQFFAELIHYDLPWQVARLEQRIGRLDRLGRSIPQVPIGTLIAESTEEQAALRCFDEGLGVFRRSASGLEFALRNVEAMIVKTALKGDFDDLLALVPALAATATAERAEDESMELSDEASFERAAAADYRSAQSSPAREKILENTFAEFFKMITSASSVRFPRDAITGDAVMVFHPDDIPSDLFPEGSTPIVDKRAGTFRREVAQERPDLEFFAPTNPFYDYVAAIMFQSLRGRTFAIECVNTGPAWSGFEIIFRAGIGGSRLAEQPSLRNHAERIFATRLERIWVADDGKIADGTTLASLRQGLTREGKGRGWTNLTKENAEALEAAYKTEGWAQVVERAVIAGRKRAREVFLASLGPRLELEKERIRGQLKDLERRAEASARNDREGLELYLDELSNWDVSVDSLGFFAVNRGIGVRR